MGAVFNNGACRSYCFSGWCIHLQWDFGTKVLGTEQRSACRAKRGVRRYYIKNCLIKCCPNLDALRLLLGVFPDKKCPEFFQDSLTMIL